MKLNTVSIFTILLIGLGIPALLKCGQPIDQQTAYSETVRVIFVEWKPHEGRMTTQGLNGVELTEEEVSTLAAQNVSGMLNVVGATLHGSRDDPKPRRVVIVMQHQIEAPVELRQPGKSNAIYLQLNSEWRMLPPGTKTSDRIIRLEVNQDYKNQTMYWYQLPDGARQGKTAFIW